MSCGWIGFCNVVAGEPDLQPATATPQLDIATSIVAGLEVIDQTIANS